MQDLVGLVFLEYFLDFFVVGGFGQGQYQQDVCFLWVQCIGDYEVQFVIVSFVVVCYDVLVDVVGMYDYDVFFVGFGQ